MDKEKILSQNALFKTLSVSELHALSQTATVERYNASHLIFNEGDIGNKVYIIVSGVVRIFTYTPQGEEIVLARLEANDYFGEQALLNASPLPRNASAMTLAPVELLVISHQDFQKFICSSPEWVSLIKEKGAQQIVNNMALKLKEEANKAQLFFASNPIQTIALREIVYRQGQVADHVYYLIEGLIETRAYDQEMKIQGRHLIRPGNFFGEQDYLKEKKHASTAVALTPSKVINIPANIFEKSFQENPQLKAMIHAKMQLFEMPLVGALSQSSVVFLNRPAIAFTIKKNDGELITAFRVINAPIYGIQNQEPVETKYIFSESQDKMREMLLKDNKLIGVYSVGAWLDLDLMTQYVCNKIAIDDHAIEKFKKTGFIAADQDHLITNKDILCHCMQVSYKKIDELINAGHTQLEELCEVSKAGLICGGCRPRIAELLGTDVWKLAKVSRIFTHNKKVRSYLFTVLSPEEYVALAGQHCVIQGNINGKRVERSYTLTLADPSAKTVEMTVKLEEKGLFSQWLFDKVKIGDILKISPAQGNFLLPKQTTLPIIFFAAGIGITPAIAFIRSRIANQINQPIYIDYSMRDREDKVFIDEINEWSQLAFISIKERVTNEVGRINEMDIKHYLSLHNDAMIYVCGPAQFQESILSILAKENIPSARVHIERFIDAGGPLNKALNEKG